MIRALEESFVARRLARRLGIWRPRTLRAEAPPRPIGAKIELLYACNLRCSFCYTDSPRHTLARTPALSDDELRSIVRQAIELGVIETVLTGGEPLMRSEIALELIETLSGEGVAVTFNTNGWYLDDQTADRLAGCDGLTVDVSIDGPTALFHDRARGVPGSWRRAVEAVDRLLARGVGHQVVSVVTPDNAEAVPDFLEQMWLLGVRSVRLTPVAEIGAAARGGGWRISRDRLRRDVGAFRKRRDDAMALIVQHGNAGLLAVRDQAAPAALLVRPNGSVLTDSLQPWVYGNAVRDGLGECWRRIAEGWRNPAVSRWARSIDRSGSVRDAEVVPYLTDEAEVPPDGSPDLPAVASHLGDEVPSPTPPKPGAELGEPDSAREFIRDLALSRRYRREQMRLGGGNGQVFARVRRDGRVLKLNASARTLLGALDGGTVADGAAALTARFGDIGRDRAERDAIAGTRSLLERGAIRPEGARAPVAASAVTGTPDLPDALPGESAGRE